MCFFVLHKAPTVAWGITLTSSLFPIHFFGVWYSTKKPKYALRNARGPKQHSATQQRLTDLCSSSVDEFRHWRESSENPQTHVYLKVEALCSPAE